MSEGITWKAFKDKLKSEGVKDDDIIWMIDLTGIGFFNYDISVWRDKDDNTITVFAG